MSISDYLQGRLEHCAAYTLTDADRAVLTRDGIEAFLFKTLTNKKFRKWAIDDGIKAHVTTAIHRSVKDGKPIEFRFPFGAYKLWRFPSSPEVDWAEFFTISYYVEYVAPVLKAYKPGVHFVFTSDDIIVERMNNIPHADTDKYIASFNTLLDEFHKYFPANLRMELVRVVDLYPDHKSYEHDLVQQLPIVEKRFLTINPERRLKRNTTSEMNIRWDGAQDWTGLSDDQKRSVIERGPILHDAHCDVPRRMEYVFGDDKVVIFSNPNRLSIPIGTTKSSRTKFWTGFGVLEQHDNAFLDRILSPEQYERVKNEDHEIVRTNLIPIRNFSEVMVFARPFKFGSAA